MTVATESYTASTTGTKSEHVVGAVDSGDWRDISLLKLRFFPQRRDSCIREGGSFDASVHRLSAETLIRSAQPSLHSFGSRAMIVLHEREKLIQAIIFFSQNTRNLGKTKLYKLLYFLDFEHFKMTGRSVTGLVYNAWPMGPVPVALHEEIPSPGSDLAEAIRFGERIVSGDRAMLSVEPKTSFSDEHFSKREMKLLSDLSSRYYNTKADEMVEATHLENLPWHKIYEEQGRKQERIPYDMALRPDEADFMRQVVREREELLDRLG